jgi:hypothetical protein
MLFDVPLDELRHPFDGREGTHTIHAEKGLRRPADAAGG